MLRFLLPFLLTDQVHHNPQRARVAAVSAYAALSSPAPAPAPTPAPIPVPAPKPSQPKAPLMPAVQCINGQCYPVSQPKTRNNSGR
jgi:hypothetical protein